jgi:hypothetical protein
MVSLVASAAQGTGLALAGPAEADEAADGADDGADDEPEAEPAAAAGAEDAATDAADVADVVEALAPPVPPEAAGVELPPPHAVRHVTAARPRAIPPRLLTYGSRWRPGSARLDRFMATSWSVE